MVILGVLGLIAVGVSLKQFRYDPSVFSAAAPQESAAAGRTVSATDSSPFLAFLPAELAVMSAPEKFGPENLSDKIDGKAEYYLSAGFRELQCQRFNVRGHPDSWLEIFVYEMDTPRHAFAVFSGQRRERATKANFAPFAYQTQNALYFAHGRRYVEVVAADANDALMQAMVSFARQFVKGTAAEQAELVELTLFPRENLREDSVMLLSADAFGFDRFDNVFTANYTVGNTEVTAFLSARKTNAEAATLADAYGNFLVEMGGTELKPSASIPGARLMEIAGTYELVFVRDEFLGGVHGAESKDAAETVAAALYQKLSERSK
jgi:hypothetical protein